MSTELFSRPLEGCDAVQFRISEAADTGESLPAEVQAHLGGCEACARFAGTWLPGPPDVLARLVAVETSSHVLRERILDAQVVPANVVRFPAPASSSRRPGVVWLGRVAACAAFAGFAYWLLDPVVSPVGPPSWTASAGAPSMTRTVIRLEDQRREEGEILRSVVVEGGSRVQRDATWSMSSLEQ